MILVAHYWSCSVVSWEVQSSNPIMLSLEGLGPFFLIQAIMWRPLIGPTWSPCVYQLKLPPNHTINVQPPIVLPHQLPNQLPSIYHVITCFPYHHTVWHMSQWNWCHISCLYIHTCHMSLWDVATSFSCIVWIPHGILWGCCVGLLQDICMFVQKFRTL